MKILLLTQVLPYPPDSGPRIKTWNVIKYLAKRHEITLVSFVRDESPDDLEALRPYCHEIHTIPMRRGRIRDFWALLRSLVTGRPWLMVRDDRRAMRDMIDVVVDRDRFDIVHADQLNMCQYAWRLPQTFKLFDAHNALWLLYKRVAATMKQGPARWLLEREWRLLKWYEAAVCRDFDATTAVSEVDKAALESTHESTPRQALNIHVVPISVDVQEMAPIPAKADSRLHHVLSIGTMFWPPNSDAVRWFCNEIWPLVLKEQSHAVFDVVGARPPRWIKQLASRTPNVNVTGYIANTSPHLERCAAFVVPIRAGGGMRVKILDALARGVPVVSTTLGCEGIEVTSGKHILIADSPAEFASSIVRLLEDSELRGQLIHHGRQLIAARYDQRIALRPLDDIYLDDMKMDETVVATDRIA